MIPWEVVVPGGPEGEKVDGIAVEIHRVEGVDTFIAVIIGRRMSWFSRLEVEWGAPHPVDTRPM